MGPYATITPSLITSRIKELYKQELALQVDQYGIFLKDFELKFSQKIRLSEKQSSAHYFKLPVPSSDSLIGTQVQMVDFYNQNNEIVSSKSVYLNISATVPVVVAARLIPKGKKINEQDIELKNKQISQKMAYLKTYIYNKSELENKESKYTIAKGNCISVDVINDYPIIRKGDEINIMYKKKWGYLKVEGTALTNGKLGNYISVSPKISQNKKKLKARIIDENNVYID